MLHFMNSPQVLSTRARKGVVLSDIKIQVCLFAFDLLYLNGRPLLKEQLNVRREVNPAITTSYFSVET